jgi:DNA-binding transcriptional MerR regulator
MPLESRLLRIGEFSRIAQVTVRTLRHYDDFGLLKPAKIDTFTDYRYYTLEQLPRVNRILALRDLGFSLDQIARLLENEVNVEQLRGMLLLRRAELEQSIADAEERLRRIGQRLDDIDRENQPSPYEIVVKRLPARLVASIRTVVPALADMERERVAALKVLYGWLGQRGIAGREELFLYHNLEYTEHDIDMEVAVEIDAPAEGSDGVTVRRLPAEEQAATTIYCGPFPEVIRAISAVHRWIGANGGSPSGAGRELHLFGRELELESYEVTLEYQVPFVRDAGTE